MDCAPNRHTACTLKLQKTLLFTHTHPSLLYYFLSFPHTEILGNGSLQNLPVLLDFHPPHPRADTGALCQDPPLELSGLPTAGLLHMRDQEGAATIPVTHMPRHWKALGVLGVRGVGWLSRDLPHFGAWKSLGICVRNCKPLDSSLTCYSKARKWKFVSCLVLCFPVQRDEASRDPFHTTQYKTAKNCKISWRELYHLEKILEKNWLKSLSLYTDVFVEVLNLCSVTAE